MSDSEKHIPVSVLLLTLNEEENLPRCLAALSWCDDIVVLDSFSSDKTVEIAEGRGGRVFQRRFDNFAGQRNYALQNIDFKYAWIFHLDADEIFTEPLLREIAAKIESNLYEAYLIPSKTMFMGRWLRYSGMYPAYQVRLSRVAGFRFRQDGHGQKEDIPVERIGTLTEPYLHYSFSKGVAEWIDKHNRYSSQEADLILSAGFTRIHWAGLFTADRYGRRKVLKQLANRLPCRSSFRFLYMYFLRMGFLDGYPGFVYCRLLSWYEFMIALKIREKKRKMKV